MNKVSLAFLFIFFVWSSVAVPLKPDESNDHQDLDQKHPVSKPEDPLPPPPPAPIDKRPVREVTGEDHLHLPLPQLQNKENSKPHETTTEKRNKRSSSDDSDSDEDDRRVENLNKEDTPKKRPARQAHEAHNQNPPAISHGNKAVQVTTEKNRKAREATTTPKVPSINLQTTTENVRKVRDIESPKYTGIAPLPAKIDDPIQNKDSITTTAKP